MVIAPYCEDDCDMPYLKGLGAKVGKSIK